ncbi:acetyltransferase [Burkholderia sp. Ch1-1]|nr:acetyltransferase [Burkholderia sp. Ch1-1]
MYRPITDEDIPAIVKLVNRAYRGSGETAGWSSGEAYLAGDRTTEALLRADLKERPSALLLKWQDDLVEGICGCVWLEPMGEGTWYLGMLATEPERQNSGLGRAMLAAAEEWVREHGAKRIRMSVINVREALVAWYLRRGYAKTGEVERFPYGDNQFGKPLRNDLCFVILEKTF